MSSRTLCGACNAELVQKNSAGEGDTIISCSKCTEKYHALCLKLSREDSKALRQKTNKYVCPQCKMSGKQIRNDDTPVRSTSRAPTLEQHTGRGETDDTCFLDTARGLAELPVPKEVLSSFTMAVQQLQQLFNSMKQEMKNFTTALNYSAEEITEFRSEITHIKGQLRELESYKTEVQNLRVEVAGLRQELAYKEQRSYLKDVEISGLTEVQGENLHHIVSVICTKLGVNLDPRDVDDVRRVGKKGENASNGSERPRPVVLTLTRRAPRNNILSAARVRRGLTTAGLGISGNDRQVYLNEHLTKENRILYSKARSVKKQLKFKYAWTSNGSIFLRRSDTSSVLHVTSEATLNRVLLNAQRSQGQERARSGDFDSIRVTDTPHGSDSQATEEAVDPLLNCAPTVQSQAFPQSPI